MFLKYCAKQCPNGKCGMYFQLMKDSECSHMQCPRCTQWFCWVCSNVAKGQMHFKQNPQCKNLEGSFQPSEITAEMMEKHIGPSNEYINIKFCARCPKCKVINEKKTRANSLNCVNCAELFCYICNKSIGGLEHYTCTKSICHAESDWWNDL